METEKFIHHLETEQEEEQQYKLHLQRKQQFNPENENDNNNNSIKNSNSSHNSSGSSVGPSASLNDYQTRQMSHASRAAKEREKLQQIQTNSTNTLITKPVIDTTTFRTTTSSLLQQQQQQQQLTSSTSSTTSTSSGKSTTPSTSSSFVPPNGAEGFTLILNVICSFLHTLRYPSTQLTALDLFSLFGKYLDSGNPSIQFILWKYSIKLRISNLIFVLISISLEIRLQRIVPYVMSLLNEESALVRATALRVLSSVVRNCWPLFPWELLSIYCYIQPCLLLHNWLSHSLFSSRKWKPSLPAILMYSPHISFPH